MKPSWRGSLAFGLVYIPVELYNAVSPHTFSFKLLHGACNTPITYHRWCTHCQKEVAWEHIEKGIQLRDGSFFIMTPSYVKKLKPQKTDTISIVEFIDSAMIDPVLISEHYYVLPAKNAQKAFFLFSAALAKLDKIAIGKFVMRDKEYVGAIRAYRSILLLTILNYSYEVKKIPGIAELSTPKIDPAELKLAQELISKLSKKTFAIEDFKDSFAVKLIRKIQQLKKGVAIAPIKKTVIEPKEISLMTSLQASLKNLPRQVKRKKR